MARAALVMGGTSGIVSDRRVDLSIEPLPTMMAAGLGGGKQFNTVLVRDRGKGHEKEGNKE